MAKQGSSIPAIPVKHNKPATLISVALTGTLRISARPFPSPTNISFPRLCDGGGPGRGRGGQPGQPGENCTPLRNVLIIQESDKVFPDDNLGGGEICFDFVRDVAIRFVGLMDLPANRDDRIRIETSGGDEFEETVVGRGNNGVFNQFLNTGFDVQRLCVVLLGEGAITSIGICLDGTANPVPTDSPVDQPTTSPTTSSQPSSHPTASPAPTNTGVPSASPSDPILGSISGNVKEDINNDDIGDINLVTVRIDLLDSTGMIVATRFTDVNGNYVFNDLPMGSYTVVETNLPNYVDVSDTDPPNDNMISVTLSVGGVVNSTENNFVDELFTTPSVSVSPSGEPTVSPGPTNTGVPSASPSDPILGSISGNVKEDIDNNDTGDVNLVNVRIDLVNSVGVIVATRFTDSEGNYVFNDLPMGSYIVIETNLPNYVDVSDTDPPNDNRISVILSAGGVVNSTDNDFVDELVSSAPSFSGVPTSSPTLQPAGAAPIPPLTDVPSSAPSSSSAPSAFCRERALIDFETDGNGAQLNAGDFVGDDWFDKYQITVTATATIGGFTPNGDARIFDTANPGESQQGGDPDLGSPNRYVQSCLVGLEYDDSHLLQILSGRRRRTWNRRSSWCTR